MTEPEIIIKMREALDILKEKLSESQGPWLVLDFLEASLNPKSDHWTRKIILAEQLSEPYLPKGETPQ